MSIVRLAPLAGIALCVAACTDSLAPSSDASRMAADVYTVTATITTTISTTGSATVGTCGSYVVAYSPILTTGDSLMAPIPSAPVATGECSGKD